MRVCVVGAGAVGGTIAALLAEAGADVGVVVRDAHVAELRRTRFRLEMNDRTVARAVRVMGAGEGAHDHDVVVLALKAQALPAMAERCASFARPGALYVTTQNGVPFWFGAGLAGFRPDESLPSVDPGGLLRRFVPARDVAGAVVHFSAELEGPGVVRLHAGRTLLLGVPDRAAEARARAFFTLVETSAFEARWTDDLYRDVWTKLLGNACFNPVSALTGATADAIATDPHVRALCLRLMTEVRALGERLGVRVAVTNDERMAMAERLGAFKTSMLQDMERGKPLELEAMLVAVVELAERVNVAVPTVRDVLGLVALRERAARGPV